MGRYSPNDAPEPPLSGKALASLILGVVGLCVPLVPIAALVLGILGLRDIGRRRRDGGARAGHGVAIVGIVLSCLGFATSTVLLPLALLLPAVERVREAATRAQSRANLQALALAMHQYNESFARLPPSVVADANGKPLYSWRVVLLPFLGEDFLYRKFHLDEAWDGPHNKPLLAEMPKVFAVAGQPAAEPYATYYQVIDGPGAAFDSAQKFGARLPADFPDGTANTFLIVEAKSAVPWTKPGDLPYRKGAIPALGGLFVGGFHAAFADGSVRFLSQNTSAETIEAMITRAGGEVIPDP